MLATAAPSTRRLYARRQRGNSTPARPRSLLRLHHPRDIRLPHRGSPCPPGGCYRRFGSRGDSSFVDHERSHHTARREHSSKTGFCSLFFFSPVLCPGSIDCLFAKLASTPALDSSSSTVRSNASHACSQASPVHASRAHVCDSVRRIAGLGQAPILGALDLSVQRCRAGARWRRETESVRIASIALARQSCNASSTLEADVLTKTPVSAMRRLSTPARPRALPSAKQACRAYDHDSTHPCTGTPRSTAASDLSTVALWPC